MPSKVVNIPYGTKNPYQNMMYMSCAPEFTLAAARNAEINSFGRPEFRSENDIVHLHWDDRLFRIPDEDGAPPDQGFLRARDQLKGFQDQGGRVIWTIHNRFAHSRTSQSDGFRAVRQQLSDLVDLIHVHTPHARQHMIEVYGADPDKIRLIPHPSYLGVYEPEESTINRPMAHRDFTRFLTFGTMRGNRELERLEHAAKKLVNRGYDFHLSVVGRVFWPGRHLMRQMQSNPKVTVTPDRIPDQDIPAVFSDAHAYVLPSTTTFTSGTAMLALSFGLPIIAPDTAAHRDTTPEACHDLLYEPHTARGLIRMLRHVMQMTDKELSEKRQACFDFAIERHPENVSQMLANTLKELVGEPGT